MFQQLWGQELQGHPRFFELLTDIGKLHSSKNQDYGGTKQHPFQVYKESSEIGIEPWRAALSRLSEKWARLKSFAKNETYKVEDETFTDTLKDMAVISLIVLILYEEEKHAEQKNVPPPVRKRNEPGDRSGIAEELSDELNTAFQTGYKEKDTGPTDSGVSKVPKPEHTGDDGSSSRMGESPS